MCNSCFILVVSAIEAKRQELLAQIELEEEGIANGKAAKCYMNTTLSYYGASLLRFVRFVFASLDAASIAPAQIPEEEKEQRRMLDILMAYRLTGVTVFTEDEFDDQSSNLDLDDDQNDNDPTKKQIGIRIETFAQGTTDSQCPLFLRHFHRWPV